MINQFLAGAEDLPDDINEAMDVLLNLKSTVSERIANVQMELGEIAGLFLIYEED